jgi:hypothetical protein
MEGLFPLSRMVACGVVFSEEGKVLPSTSSKITGMEMLTKAVARDAGWIGEPRYSFEGTGRHGATACRSA